MINFKIDVFIGLDDCRKTHFNRVGYFYDNSTFERYKVFINNEEVLNADHTFYRNFENNSVVSLKIVDLTGQLADYEQSIQLYDKDVWLDIALLYNKEYSGITNYNCFLGISGENQNEYNNEGDYLRGSNYFEWEYYSTSNASTGINDVTGVIRVQRIRDVNGILIPFYTSAWEVASTISIISGSKTAITFVTDRIAGYESYYESVFDINDNLIGYSLDIDSSLVDAYLAYRHQTSNTSIEDCCGNGTTSVFEDCMYPFEVTDYTTKNRSYCNSDIAIIDVPCSRNKYLYKTSSSIYPIKVEVNCDGIWKTLGSINDVLLLNVEHSSVICNKDTFEIRTSCESDYTDCCGNESHTENSCMNYYTINTLSTCPTGELILQQSICKDTLDCDECGGIEGRFVTNQNVNINTLVDWTNVESWYYHNENQISVVPFENKLTYYIDKKQSDGTYLNIFVSDEIDLSQEVPFIDYMFTSDGIYKVKVVITNQCKSIEIIKDLYVYSKNVIERLDCNNYRLWHCIDTDFNLTVTDYNTKELVYMYDASIDKETYYKSNIKIKYNQDYYSYDINLTEDNIYRVDYNNNTFIILHDCFITNCHQEYIKSLLCEGDICDVLLDKCLVTDDTLLKVYLIQKYVLLYDVYKSLASKIVNIEYAHIINPIIILEDNSCIDLYNLWDIIQKLKEMCVKCGFNTTETDDCGCN